MPNHLLAPRRAGNKWACSTWLMPCLTVGTLVWGSHDPSSVFVRITTSKDGSENQVQNESSDPAPLLSNTEWKALRWFRSRKKKLTKKKPNKKAKRRTACLAEKSKTTHPSAPSLYQLNTAARRRASAAQHRAAAHTLPTNHSWDVYGQSIKNPFWWLEGPLDSFQIMGLAPCLQQWEKAITTVSGQWH